MKNSKFNQLNHDLKNHTLAQQELKLWANKVKDSVWRILGDNPNIEELEAMLVYLSNAGYDGVETLYIMRLIEELKERK